jgi:hypothetical protein
MVNPCLHAWILLGSSLSFFGSDTEICPPLYEAEKPKRKIRRK